MTRVLVMDIPGWSDRFDDEAAAVRHFDPVIVSVENTVPLVRVLRPGRIAMGARGPARYYRGEDLAAAALRAVHPDARIGIADGLFTAVTAATRANPVRIVPAGGSAEFLASLSVDRVGDADLVGLLRRLGITTLGAFAALDAGAVRDRFGVAGELLHRSAAGHDDSPVISRDVPVDYARVVECEPAIVRADELAFTIRAVADEFIDTLARARFVCTAVWVTLSTERGDEHERCWAHPRSFTASDVVDRVRWQLDSIARFTTDTSTEGFAGDGIVRVRIAPDQLAHISRYEPALWGEPAGDRIHSVLSRVQSILGHDGVLTATVTGGRTLADREVLSPWGDKPVVERRAAEPWPGHLAALLPTTVYLDRPTVVVRGRTVIAPAEVLSEAPRWLVHNGRQRELIAWSGPWPLHERWWDGGSLNFRLQAVDAIGTAWVLLSDGETWTIEARYD